MSPVHNYRNEIGSESEDLEFSAREVLELHGPVIPVEATPLYEDAGSRASDSGVEPVRGLGLLDTGAAHSCIDLEVADSLGFPVVDRLSISGVGSTNVHPVFVGALEIPSPDGPEKLSFGPVRMVGAELDDQERLALIGSDLLADCLLIYNGRTGAFSLSY